MTGGFRRAVVLASLALLGAAPARAETSARAEAAERFDRGMALLEEGDNAGALAELTRVYEIAPHPQVLYNLGLVYAALGRPVEAVRTFDRLLANPGALPEARLARARDTRQRQALRVGWLEVTTSAPASIEVDGVIVGPTPLAEPIALAAGNHVVAALGPSYLPVGKEVLIAGQAHVALELELQPSERPLAHLTIRAAVPGADVLVDGQAVGRTPLPGSVAVAPGRRAVELRRAGYRPARQELTLDDGATAETTFDLAEDEGARAKLGWLVLAVSEADPDVVVDGRPRGAYGEPIALQPGPHDVRVARAGFLAAERTVFVPEGARTTTHVTLVPTPETRVAYKQRARLMRGLGWGGVVGGVVIAGAATAVVALNRGALDRATADYDSVAAACEAGGLDNRRECDRNQAVADELNHRENLQTFGIIGAVVGVAAAGTGVALLLLGDDPSRYDRVARDRDQPALGGWFAPGGGGLRLAGTF
jgi:hypothetical protein